MALNKFTFFFHNMNNCTLDKVFLEAKTRMLTITEYVVLFVLLLLICLQSVLKKHCVLTQRCQNKIGYFYTLTLIDLFFSMRKFE